MPDPLRSEHRGKLTVPVIHICSRHLAQITPALLRTSEEADRPSHAHSVVAILQKRATRKASETKSKVLILLEGKEQELVLGGLEAFDASQGVRDAKMTPFNAKNNARITRALCGGVRVRSSQATQFERLCCTKSGVLAL